MKVEFTRRQDFAAVHDRWPLTHNRYKVPLTSTTVKRALLEAVSRTSRQVSAGV